MGERGDIEEALRKQRAILAKLEAQAAGFGSLFVPVHLLLQIDDARAKIADLENQIVTLPVTDPSTPTNHDHQRLTELETEFNNLLHLRDLTQHALTAEHDPRKKRRLRMEIKNFELNLGQIYDDYIKAGGDPHKYSL